MNSKTFFTLTSLIVASTSFGQGTDLPQCNHWKYCLDTQVSPYDVPSQTNFFEFDGLQIKNAADLWMTVDDGNAFSVRGPKNTLVLTLSPDDPTNILEIGTLQNTVLGDGTDAYSELVLNPDVSLSSTYTKNNLPTDDSEEWCDGGITAITVEYRTTVKFSQNGLVKATLTGTNPVNVSTGKTCTSIGHGGHQAP